jgi:hypothetical protein
MKTLIVYFDETRKNFQKITPLRQGVGYRSDERFDDNWAALAYHVSRGNYYKFEIA